MTLTDINNKITHDITLAKRRAKREMTKKGFVNVSGEIMQYNPMTTSFIKVSDKDTVMFFNWIIGTHWGTMNPGNIIDYLKEQLPNLAASDVNNFTSYVKQSQIVINENKIQELMTNAIADNEVFTNKDIDFKGKLNLQSELIILRNNNIFSDGDFLLFKLTDGEFKRVTADDVYQLLRKNIGTENTKLVLQYVKNHWRSYADSLTNISQLYNLLWEKQLKEDTLSQCKPGFDNVMGVISSYGGK